MRCFQRSVFCASCLCILLLLPSGCRSIHRSAANGNNTEVLDYLSKGIDVNVKDSNGMTPFCCAVEKGRIETAELLLDKGANINADDKSGKTPLMFAADDGNLPMLEFLLLNKAEVSPVAFNIAVNEGKRNAAVLIFENLNGYNLLHSAANSGDLNKVEKCISKKFDLNSRDIDGITPLHYAVRNGNAEMIKALLEKGADVNVKDNDGFSPLHYALLSGRVEICKILIGKGADLNAKTITGKTAADIAKDSGKSELIDIVKQ
ncbi:MAG: ankyrin repeat domain-containing protein [Victivallales bacterium]